MRTGIFFLAAATLLTTGVAACGGEPEAPKSPKIGVILPDSKTSIRWETTDRKYLKEAFDAAGIPSDIQNAEGDKARFAAIADQMIADGVTVLIIVNLSSTSGKRVLDKAAAKGVATIDYDRLTLNGNARYYVSFDNRAVGALQGQGLVNCLEQQAPRTAKPVIAELHGSPTDSNAADYRRGYDSVLEDKYFGGEYTKGPDQPVQDWDNDLGGMIFAQMLAQTKNRIDGVIAANDGLAGAVVAELRKRRLNGKVPVTGQDAEVAALQRILAGDQCMTVFKDTKKQAGAAAELAVSLAKGQRRPAPTAVKDAESGSDVPAVLLQPEAITRENVKTVVDAGYVSEKDLCKGEIARLCDLHGVR